MLSANRVPPFDQINNFFSGFKKCISVRIKSSKVMTVFDFFIDDEVC